MKLNSKLATSVVRTAWHLIVAVVALIAMLANSGDVNVREVVQRRLSPVPSHPTKPGGTAGGTSAPVDRDRTVKRKVLALDGDRHLDVAIALDDTAPADFDRYTVRLRLASGAEQSFAVSAPFGGLRPEVRDMTGDNVRNDVILAPALLQWPRTVLLNDGHDHFVVAVTPAPGGALVDGTVEASGRDLQSVVALRSAGFNTGGLANGRGLLRIQVGCDLVPSPTNTGVKDLFHPASSGRAPPAA